MQTSQPIVVGVDGSTASLEALREAGRNIRRKNLRIKRSELRQRRQRSGHHGQGENIGRRAQIRDSLANVRQFLKPAPKIVRDSEFVRDNCLPL